ncbi:MAG: hypothetical protein ACI9BF_000359 [Candidatus Paceibacteria bacterium]|jgi:hypothetical protein
MKIKVVWVIPVVLAIILQLSLLTVEIDYGGLYALWWLLLYVVLPAIILIPPIISLLVVKDKRLKFFSTMLLFGIISNAVGLTLFGIYETTKPDQRYQDDPQLLHTLHPNRPLTIMKPWFGDPLTEFLDIEVYAHDDYVGTGEALVAELRSDLGPDIAPVSEIVLTTVNERPSNDARRSIYTGTITSDLVNLDGDVPYYYIVVKSESGLIDIREIELP